MLEVGESQWESLERAQVMEESLHQSSGSGEDDEEEIEGRMIQELEVTELLRQLDMNVKKGKEPRTIVGF